MSALATVNDQQCLFAAFPRRPGYVPGEEKPGSIAMLRPTFRGKLKAAKSSSSLLCLTFNRLWAMALNCRDDAHLTDWLMQHDDIFPDRTGFGDVLIDERDAHGAAVMSAVVPIKDERYLTTTAIRNSETGDTRRLTMKEIWRLPETFGLEDVHALGITSGGPIEDDLLAVNTGLWVCRIDAPWVEHFPGFSMTDAVRRRADGVWEAGCVSEDWQFSEWLARRGLKAMATRKVTLSHRDHNGKNWRNDHIGDGWEIDRGDNPE